MQLYQQYYGQDLFVRERLFWIATKMYEIYQPALLNEIVQEGYYGRNTEEDHMNYDYMFEIGMFPIKV